MSLHKLVLPLLVALSLAVPALAEPVDPVAVVNGEPITRAEFISTLEEVAGAQILDRMITVRLLLQANKKEKLVAPEEIDREFADVRAQFPAETEFLAALKANGLTPDSLRQQIEAKLVLDRLAVKGVTVSDEEIAQYFEQNQEELGEPEQVRARHILVTEEEEAKKLIEELKAGADFAKLAAEHSKDPGSQGHGGDLGFFRRGELVPEFEAVAFALKPGEVSSPVKTEFGWHVIKVEEHKAAVPATLAAKREEIRSILLKQKTKQPSEVLAELRTESEVKILWQ
ncbi:MAG: peptidylprolyl isomerase [Bacillota bacterium]|nr:peptidylprolyl isomerase [Bacillota bacterium]